MERKLRTPFSLEQKYVHVSKSDLLSFSCLLFIAIMDEHFFGDKMVENEKK